MVKDIWLNFNGQKYWWHFSLPPQGPNEIMAPPNSDTVISGVPLEHPYLVRSAENFELQNSLPIDARNAFEEIGLTAKKPTELWAKLAIIANRKLVISSQLFRINKNNVRQYQPGSEF